MKIALVERQLFGRLEDEHRTLVILGANHRLRFNRTPILMKRGRFVDGVIVEEEASMEQLKKELEQECGASLTQKSVPRVGKRCMPLAA